MSANKGCQLAEVLPARTSPELLSLETKWAARMSDGLTLDLLEESLPISQALSTSAIRQHVTRVAERLEGWFEVIVGKSVPTEGPATCFGFVPRPDAKPKRRLFEVLKAQGLQMNRQSSLKQVLENTESTERQYALRERAMALGWHEDRIVVIDRERVIEGQPYNYYLNFALSG